MAQASYLREVARRSAGGLPTLEPPAAILRRWQAISFVSELQSAAAAAPAAEGHALAPTRPRDYQSGSEPVSLGTPIIEAPVGHEPARGLEPVAPPEAAAWAAEHGLRFPRPAIAPLSPGRVPTERPAGAQPRSEAAGLEPAAPIGRRTGDSSTSSRPAVGMQPRPRGSAASEHQAPTGAGSLRSEEVSTEPVQAILVPRPPVPRPPATASRPDAKAESSAGVSISIGSVEVRIVPPLPPAPAAAPAPVPQAHAVSPLSRELTSAFGLRQG